MKTPRILYVEDNDDNAFMLARRLKRHGYEVLVARDGEEGVAVATRERPDLILMDLRLPKIDGWEATRQLKMQPETRDIPIIAVSSYAMKGDREKAIATGCDDYDTKPIEFDHLLGKIDALLRREPDR